MSKVEQVIPRRNFLSAFGGVALACQAAEAVRPSAESTPPKDEWAAFRAEFALAPDWVHLAGFLLASHPRRVRDAIERHRRALDENPALYVEAHAFDAKPVLDPAAAYLGVRPEEIALTDSTTMGLALLYSGLPLTSADDVLTTTHDHYSTHESLRLVTLRYGAKLRKVPLYDTPAKASVDGMTKALTAAILPSTRVVAVTWVHSSTGVRTPVRAIADEVARLNRTRNAERQILLCVDGVHGFGIENVTMADLGADFFVAGTHKWLFGPRGTGIIWGKAEHWPKLRPTIPHFGAAAYGAWMQGVPPPPTSADMMTPGGFHTFEHRWALGEAFALHLALGKAKVAARIHELNTHCKQSLAKLKHVTLHTPVPDELSSGIITFEVAGSTPEQVVKRLHERRIVASTTPYATSYARLAPGLINSEQDVERAVGEIEQMGSRTTG